MLITMKERENSILAVMKNDLMDVYREVCGSYSCRNNTEAWERVVRHPAPRFYVSSRRAHQYLSPMLHGDRSRIESLSPLKREMYEALFETVLSLWQKRAYCGRSLYYVLHFAVLEPAPRFYIEASRMGQIWREERLRHCRSIQDRKKGGGQ